MLLAADFRKIAAPEKRVVPGQAGWAGERRGPDGGGREASEWKRAGGGGPWKEAERAERVERAREAERRRVGDTHSRTTTHHAPRINPTHCKRQVPPNGVFNAL